MRQDGQMSRFPRLLLAGFAVPVCAILCCVVWLSVIAIKDSPGVENNEILVNTKVDIDTSSLPVPPKLENWYALGWQLLQDNGWDLAPNLASVQTFAPCGEFTPVLNDVNLDYYDAYFDGLRPCRKHGFVALDRDPGTAWVLIEYNALRWRHLPPIDFTKVKVGLQEALRIADSYKGREYRESLNDQCDVSISLGRDSWEISYRNHETSRWEFWAILIDVGTGEVWLEEP
jgi:hypothetical protein